jgi:hypothetical protein
MDPFAVLPRELAVYVLLLVESGWRRRPRHLRAALQVSKRWNSVGMQPELWRDLELKKTHSDEVVERLLQRVDGSLRTLRLKGNVFGELGVERRHRASDIPRSVGRSCSRLRHGRDGLA